ncbi:hypothetical protein EMIHUDRAFT_453064 [Emiliania huxleyi CCMP1516]|uniref:Uncharacterized protein n=2 Tax=Emiliania huxleyi TaxID=2903 RepID=A0A0D3IBL4_EMIH1|nr:hypothetical protein EMIHUDRAFT_453064 [Emiliania huxleyi CCMP1516]EOD08649.1 hypothetical protein EMIHUDRAFT_453064 [Emiliania huxleyi CCMP1516]|eukprot:XP_005761078.1 hypothetical protein EMIHUDRAFT_453064 [Emiliania huxleyi CCMP1516]
MDNLMSFSEGADPSKQRKSKSNRWSGASNSDGRRWRVRNQRYSGRAQEDGTVPKGFKFCPICGDSFHGTPNPKAKPPAVAEEWQCEGCGEVSIAGWYYCFECGRPHGAPKPPPPGECGGCGEYVPEGDLWKFCWNCGTATGEWDSGAKGRAARFETNEELGDWTCHGCREEAAALPAPLAACCGDEILPVLRCAKAGLMGTAGLVGASFAASRLLLPHPHYACASRAAARRLCRVSLSLCVPVR